MITLLNPEERLLSSRQWLIFLLKFKGIVTGAFIDKWSDAMCTLISTGCPGQGGNECTVMDGIKCIFHHLWTLEEKTAFKTLIRREELQGSPVPHRPGVQAGGLGPAVCPPPGKCKRLEVPGAPRPSQSSPPWLTEGQGVTATLAMSTLSSRCKDSASCQLTEDKEGVWPEAGASLCACSHRGHGLDCPVCSISRGPRNLARLLLKGTPSGRQRVPFSAGGEEDLQVFGRGHVQRQPASPPLGGPSATASNCLVTRLPGRCC